jgi:hypothetical protein
MRISGVIVVFMLIFPPFRSEYKGDIVASSRYGFLLSPPVPINDYAGAPEVATATLSVQIIAVLIAAALFYFAARDGDKQ